MELPKKRPYIESADCTAEDPSSCAVQNAPRSVKSAKLELATSDDSMTETQRMAAMIVSLQAQLQASQSLAKTPVTPPNSSSVTQMDLDFSLVESMDAVPLQATPKAVVDFMQLVEDRQPAWVREYHWYSIYIKLPCTLKAGTNIPMVSKIEGDKIFKGKKSQVADQVVVGSEPSSAWSPKVGFTVSNTEKTKLSGVWPQITTLQSFASKLAGENRMVAVFFHSAGKFAKTPSHYHILIATKEKWAKINLRNEIGPVKFGELGYKRFEIKRIASTFVHHCQPRAEAQFIGATDARLCKALQVIRMNWTKCVGDSPSARIYNGVGEMTSDEPAPTSVEGWEGLSAPAADGGTLVEVGASLRLGGQKRQLYIDHYKTILRPLPINIYSVEQLRSSTRSGYMHSHPEQYVQLRNIFCRDKGYNYRVSLLDDALNELAMERIMAPIKDRAGELLSKYSAQEIAEVIEALEDGPPNHTLDFICIAAIILRKTGKMNAAFIHGERDAGKSTIFLNSLEWLVPHLSMKSTPNPALDRFCLADLASPQRLCFMDEFSMIPKGAHDYYKVLFGGQSTDTDQKHKGRVQTIPCPFIVMSNHSLEHIMAASLEDLTPFQVRLYVMTIRRGEMPQVRYNSSFYNIWWIALLSVLEDAPAPPPSEGTQALQEYYTTVADDILSNVIDFLDRWHQRTSGSCSAPDDPTHLLNALERAPTSPEDNCEEE